MIPAIQSTQAPEADSKPLKLATPLHWAGGKRWLVDTLASLYKPHRHRRLVEPFCGALSVTLGLQPDVSLCNDLSAPLMGFWRHLKHGMVVESLDGLTKDQYYSLREMWNAKRAGVQYGELTPTDAEAFYILNRTCFNGMWRENTYHHMTTSAGTFRKAGIPGVGGPAWVDQLRNVSLRCATFATLKVSDEDWVYCDPPYDDGFANYTAEGFDWVDHIKLADWADHHAGPIVVSNAATDRIFKLYNSRGFIITEVSAPRRIAGNGDRTPAPELLMWRGL